jgi:hypothetical protein
MTTVIKSRVAIQARIAQWQRQYRNSDYGPADVHFGRGKISSGTYDVVSASLML